MADKAFNMLMKKKRKKCAEQRRGTTTCPTLQVRYNRKRKKGSFFNCSSYTGAAERLPPAAERSVRRALSEWACAKGPTIDREQKKTE